MKRTAFSPILSNTLLARCPHSESITRFDFLSSSQEEEAYLIIQQTLSKHLTVASFAIFLSVILLNN